MNARKEDETGDAAGRAAPDLPQDGQGPPAARKGLLDILALWIAGLEVVLPLLLTIVGVLLLLLWLVRLILD